MVAPCSFRVRRSCRFCKMIAMHSADQALYIRTYIYLVGQGPTPSSVRVPGADPVLRRDVIDRRGC